MRPDIWGPHMWFSMHYIALAYPQNPTVKHMTQYHAFYTNIAHVLPCAVCAKHYNNILDTHPLTIDRLSGPNELFEWTVHVHNMVNKDLGKPQLTLQEAIEKYTDAPPSCESAPVPQYNEYDLVRTFVSAFALVLFVLFIDRFILQHRATVS